MGVDATQQGIGRRYGVALTGNLPVPVPASRADLPALCRELGFTSGAEVGVWKGAYSALFCRAGLAWTCVDPWMPYAAYRDNKNQQRLIDEAYQIARTTLDPYGVTFLRTTSVAAAAVVPDRSLDVCYIDGNHETAFVLEDVATWSPKVKVGGILAGHDYRVQREKPFIQVKAAIDGYTRAQGIAPWFIFAGDKTPSFFWVIR